VYPGHDIGFVGVAFGRLLDEVEELLVYVGTIMAVVLHEDDQRDIRELSYEGSP
jgi:hypothetical protein